MTEAEEQALRAKMAEHVEGSGANYLVCRLAFGDLPLERVLRSVELLRTEVMPAFAETRQAAE